MYGRSWVEIDEGQIARNYLAYRAALPAGTETCLWHGFWLRGAGQVSSPWQQRKRARACARRVSRG